MRSFGAKPNDNVDDTDEIQKALDTLKPGETLFFPSGRYLTSKSLKVRRPGITITGESATLHATNPDDLALIIQADDTTVSSLTFTAITDGRRSAHRHHRITVSGHQASGYRRIRNTVIRDNRIVNADGPGTPGANSAQLPAPSSCSTPSDSWSPATPSCVRWPTASTSPAGRATAAC